MPIDICGYHAITYTYIFGSCLYIYVLMMPINRWAVVPMYMRFSCHYRYVLFIPMHTCGHSANICMFWLFLYIHVGIMSIHICFDRAYTYRWVSWHYMYVLFMSMHPCGHKDNICMFWSCLHVHVRIMLIHKNGYHAYTYMCRSCQYMSVRSMSCDSFGFLIHKLIKGLHGSLFLLTYEGVVSVQLMVPCSAACP